MTLHHDILVTELGAGLYFFFLAQDILDILCVVE